MGRELLGKGGSLTFVVNMIELRDGARFGGIFREISKMLKVLYKNERPEKIMEVDTIEQCI